MSGEQTVNGRTTSLSTLQVTVTVTVTASGELLKPMIVFKGKPGVRIETREFPSYRIENLYACQDQAAILDLIGPEAICGRGTSWCPACSIPGFVSMSHG